MLWSTEALLSQSVINLNGPETVCLRHMLAADSCPGRLTGHAPLQGHILLSGQRQVTQQKDNQQETFDSSAPCCRCKLLSALSLLMTHTESFKLSVIFSSTDTTRGSSEQSAVWCKNVQKEDKRLAWSPEEQHVHVTGYKLYLKCLIMKINERLWCLWKQKYSSNKTVCSASLRSNWKP